MQLRLVDDRGERDPRRHRRDAEAVPKAPRARLRALDARASHERPHLAVRRLPGDGPKGARRPSHAPLRAPHAVHQLKGVHQVLRDWYGPPVVRAALQRRDPELARLKVDVTRADAERFGDPAPRHRERAGEGLHGGLRMRAHRGEEALAFGRGQVPPTARVDEREGVLGHGRKATLLGVEPTLVSPAAKFVMQVSTPAGPARGRARNNTRLHALAESCTRCLFRAKRPFAQWCVSPECKFGPDRDRRLDTGGAAQSATPHGRLKFSPRSRPNYLRKVTSEGRCSMGGPSERSCRGQNGRRGSRGSRSTALWPAASAGAPRPSARTATWLCSIA